MNQDEEYTLAKCREPHKDGSECRPSWDGYGYVCWTARLNSSDEKKVRR